MSTDTKDTALMEKLVSLCKRKGFIYPSSEIYGGCGGVWDYGPLGAELKRNLRDAWWQAMMRDREDIVGLDASILMNPAIWKASVCVWMPSVRISHSFAIMHATLRVNPVS